MAVKYSWNILAPSFYLSSGIRGVFDVLFFWSPKVPEASRLVNTLLSIFSPFPRVHSRRIPCFFFPLYPLPYLFPQDGAAFPRAEHPQQG